MKRNSEKILAVITFFILVISALTGCININNHEPGEGINLLYRKYAYSNIGMNGVYYNNHTYIKSGSNLYMLDGDDEIIAKYDAKFIDSKFFSVNSNGVYTTYIKAKNNASFKHDYDEYLYLTDLDTYGKTVVANKNIDEITYTIGENLYTGFGLVVDNNVAEPLRIDITKRKQVTGNGLKIYIYDDVIYMLPDDNVFDIENKVDYGRGKSRILSYDTAAGVGFVLKDNTILRFNHNEVKTLMSFDVAENYSYKSSYNTELIDYTEDADYLYLALESNMSSEKADSRNSLWQVNKKNGAKHLIFECKYNECIIAVTDECFVIRQADLLYKYSMDGTGINESINIGAAQDDSSEVKSHSFERCGGYIIIDRTTVLNISKWKYVGLE